MFEGISRKNEIRIIFYIYKLNIKKHTIVTNNWYNVTCFLP
jgi:hypothetical protein